MLLKHPTFQVSLLSCITVKAFVRVLVERYTPPRLRAGKRARAQTENCSDHEKSASIFRCVCYYDFINYYFVKYFSAFKIVTQRKLFFVPLLFPLANIFHSNKTFRNICLIKSRRKTITSLRRFTIQP